MTELDNVSIKVIEDARTIRSRNIKEAEEKARGILSEAAKKVQEKKASAKIEAKRQYDKTYDMELFKARSSLDQKVLLAKLKLVDAVIEKTRTKLAVLDKKGWTKFLKKTAKELNIKKGSYVVGKKEKVLDNSVISAIDGIEPDKGKADFDMGLKITDGKAEMLLSPQKYLDMDQESLRMKVASYLFSGEE